MALPFVLPVFFSPCQNPNRDLFFVSCADKTNPSVPTLVATTVMPPSTVHVLDRRGSEDYSRESCLALSSFSRDCCIVDVGPVSILQPQRSLG